MFTLSGSDLVRYTTASYIPVKTLSNDDGSLQWQVQENAVDGGLYAAFLVNGGQGYSANLAINITGDGTGAAAIATVNSTNAVNSIIITNPGSGYTFASINITDLSGVNAVARAIISPPGGHGSDPLYELGGKNVMINARLAGSENGILPIVNEYRQISILKDPKLAGTSNVSTLDAFSQVMKITTAGSNDYILDEVVYQGTSVANSTFSAEVLDWDAANGIVSVINTQGTPTASQSLVGVNSFTVRSVASVTDPDLQRYSGKILYADNIKPISRSSDQIEDYKIVLRY